MKKNYRQLVMAAAFMVMTGAISLVGTDITGNRVGLIEAQAADVMASWECGNTDVVLDKQGKLTVTAKPDTDGRMKFSNKYGWTDYAMSIKAIEIESGVTYISTYAFQNLFKSYNPLTVNIADTVTEIDWLAFANCNLKEVNIYSKNIEIDSDVFRIDPDKTGSQYGDKTTTINIYMAILQQALLL